MCFLLSSSSSTCRRTHTLPVSADSSQSIYYKSVSYSFERYSFLTVSLILRPTSRKPVISNAQTSLNQATWKNVFPVRHPTNLFYDLNIRSLMQFSQCISKHRRMEGKLGDETSPLSLNVSMNKTYNLHKALPIWYLCSSHPHETQYTWNIFNPFKVTVHDIGWHKVFRAGEACHGVVTCIYDFQWKGGPKEPSSQQGTAKTGFGIV